MKNIAQSFTDLVGYTPILKLNNIEKDFELGASLFAKLEYFNPASSAKDRVAVQMIEDYEKSGKINEKTVILEPTSGNTGIGLAAVCASKGYRLIIIMPDNMSIERQLLMKAYGAELVLTPGKEGMNGAIKMAEHMKEKIPGSIIAGQFVNPSNPKAHEKTTGPEIYKDMDGKVDILVAGVGTGGTITGTGKYLKSKIKNIHIVGVEPKTSAVLSGEAAGTHRIQGIGAGFIPKVLDTKLLDEICAVSNSDAYAMSKLMCKREGILVGISSGAALSAAIELARKPENKGKNIVVILPDTGEHYLSTKDFID